MKKKEKQLFEIIRDEVIVYKEKTKDVAKNSNGTSCEWLFDMRRLFLKSDQLNLSAEIFWDKMQNKWPFQIGGLEVGAIPLLSALIMKGHERGLKVNSFIIRKSRKKSGLCRQVEGEVTTDPIVIVDDLINSGNSLMRIEKVLEEMNKSIRDFFVFIDYQRKDVKKTLLRKSIKLESVFCLNEFGLSLGDSKIYYPESNTFEIAWAFGPPNPNYTFVTPRSTPVLDEQNIFYGADSGIFYCVDQVSGEPVWEFLTGKSLKGIFSSPQIYKDMVVFGAYDGSVYALNRLDGVLVWQYSGSEYIGSSPSISEDLKLVFIGLEHNVHMNKGSVVALDLETGERAWEFTVREYLHGTPIYCKEKQLVGIGTNDNNFLLLKAKTGEVLWQFETQAPIKAAPVFDLKRNQVVFGSHDRSCYGVDLESGEENFKFSTEDIVYNTPLVEGDICFVGSTDKSLYIYDLKKNKVIKKIKTHGKIFSHPSCIDENIFFGSNDGCIREIDGKTHKMIGGIYLPERILSSIVKGQKYFYAVAAGNQLLAFKRL